MISDKVKLGSSLDVTEGKCTYTAIYFFSDKFVLEVRVCRYGDRHCPHWVIGSRERNLFGSQPTGKGHCRERV